MSMCVNKSPVWNLYFPPSTRSPVNADYASHTDAAEGQSGSDTRESATQTNHAYPVHETTTGEATNWPFIQRPNISDYYHFDPIVDDHIPNCLVSVSLYALNYLSRLRDYLLSQPEKTISGWVKLGGVALLATAATIGFTLLNTIEAISRLNLAIILSPFLITYLAAQLLDIGCLKDMKLLEIPAIISGGFAVFALYDLAMTGAGALTGYEMLTNCTDLRMRDVLEIANDASFGAVAMVRSLVDKRCRLNPASYQSGVPNKNGNNEIEVTD